jgi:hypothetical protein
MNVSTSLYTHTQRVSRIGLFLVFIGGASGISAQNADIPLNQFNCITADFAQHIVVGTPEEPENISVPIERFSVASYQTHVSELNCAAGSITGIMVHYGLDEQNNFKTAYSFMCLNEITTDEYEYAISMDRVYENSEDNELVVSPLNLTQWQLAYQGNWHLNVKIQRTSNIGYVPFIVGQDAHAMVFRTNAIDAMIEDNNLSGTDMIEVVPYSAPKEVIGELETGFQPAVCFVGVQGGERLLDNDSNAGGPTFRARAANFGEGCPPACSRASFRPGNRAVRQGCE